MELFQNHVIALKQITNAWEMACMAASSGGSLPLSVRTQAQLELWCWWRLEPEISFFISLELIQAKLYLCQLISYGLEI